MCINLFSGIHTLRVKYNFGVGDLQESRLWIIDYNSLVHPRWFSIPRPLPVVLTGHCPSREHSGDSIPIFPCPHSTPLLGVYTVLSPPRLPFQDRGQGRNPRSREFRLFNFPCVPQGGRGPQRPFSGVPGSTTFPLPVTRTTLVQFPTLRGVGLRVRDGGGWSVGGEGTGDGQRGN